MLRIGYTCLTMVLLGIGLLLAGCGGGGDSLVFIPSSDIAIVGMNNGTTGFEPHLFKNGSVTLLKDINPGAADSNPYGYASYNGKIYFAANDGVHGTEIWVTDGTAAGTALFKDVYPGATGSNPTGFTVFNGKLYFSAAADASADLELWVTDGTSAGTVLFMNINPTTSSSPRSFTVFNGKLYFAAAGDAATGFELWVTDGTVAGTTLVKDINPGPGGSSPNYLTVFGGKLFFAADDGINGTELWVTDGTGAGTKLHLDINTSTTIGSNGSNPYGFTVYQGKLYFSATDTATDSEIWVTDGTIAGTTLFKDLYPLGAGGIGSPTGYTVFNNRLYFAAGDHTTGLELWDSDGIAENTTLFKDIVNGDGSSNPVSLQFLASPYFHPTMGNLAYVSGSFGSLFFVATDGVHGREIWSSNGTQAGTSMLTDFNPAGNGVYED
jgi:ELWxxDGT repeat protein